MDNVQNCDISSTIVYLLCKKIAKMTDVLLN